MNDLARRLPTTIGLLAFAYTVIEFLPLLPFTCLLFIIICLAAHELVRLCRPRIRSLPLMIANGAVIGFAFLSPDMPLALAVATVVVSYGLFFLFAIRRQDELESFVRDMGIHYLSSIYLFFPLFFIMALRRIDPHLLFFLIAVIAVGDSGAYFVGRAIGRTKIYPVASPKKSLQGLLAGVITAGAAGWLTISIFPLTVSILKVVVSGALLGLVSQLSDPVESLFKRAVGEKDSSALLPGHGGVLDRLDSYIFCAPALYFLAVYFWRL